jgi:hypothetical protein
MALIKAKQLLATDDYNFNTVTLAQTIPTLPAQAASKQYVDNSIQGLDVKQSVRTSTTGSNIDLSSAPAAIDGVTLASGNRVLVKDQTDATQNGIYVFNGAAAAMTRSADADNSGNANSEVTANLFTFVEEGSTNADSGWTLVTNNPIVLGTTSLTFAQFSGAGTVLAGIALSKTGNTLDVLVDNASIDVNLSNQLEVKAGGITNAKVASGIDAAKIADGSVSNTAFQFINSLSSNAQDQLNANATAISNEVTRAEAAEATNATAISNEVTARIAADTAIRNDLASTSLNFGASLVGIHDTANYFTSTTVEGALAELAVADASNNSAITDLQAAVGSSTGLAGLNYTSNNVVTDSTSLLGAISAIDAFFGSLVTTADFNKLHAITATATAINNAAADAHTRAYEVLAVTSNGQTAFTLTNAATFDGTVELSVNGQGQQNGVDFTVSGTSVTWASGDFALATTDIVTTSYDVAA